MINHNEFSLFGKDLFGKDISSNVGPLSKRFIYPPFSILNARDGEWQNRKRAWLSLGIKSEEGRNAHAFCTQKWFDEKKMSGGEKGNTSIFDPVLCELAYKWWCPGGGQIVDPFGGGSVRGVVAGLLGYKYHGIDLRREQNDANYSQKSEICPTAIIDWVTGDSMIEIDNAPDSDFIFSCPPYGDLEKYSDMEEDLSNMEYHTFIAAYKRIILRCAKKLKNNRLACFVVGDFRDKKTGMYRGFVADTINAFREVGMLLYNDAVLVTSIGTLPIRTSATFDKGRKLGKTHQNILVFAKGNPDFK